MSRSSHNAAPMSISESERLKKQLRDLLREQDNKICADCPIKGPTWASINLGVFICLPCSGIHRSMGTHVSQVRSTDLDTWKPEWVEVMKKWGNARSNRVWEARMPKGYEGKPSETETLDLTPKMQKFIRDKYERRKWFDANGASHADEDDLDNEEEEEEETKPKPKKRVPRSNPGEITKSNNNPTKQPDAAGNLLLDFNPFEDSTPSPSVSTSVNGLPSVSVASTSLSSFATSQTTSAPVVPPPKSGFDDIMSLYGGGQVHATQPVGMMMPTQQGNPWGSSSAQPTSHAGFGMPSTTSAMYGGGYGGGGGYPTQSYPTQSHTSQLAPMQTFSYGSSSSSWGQAPPFMQQPQQQQQQQQYRPPVHGSSMPPPTSPYDPFKGLGM